MKMNELHDYDKTYNYQLDSFRIIHSHNKENPNICLYDFYINDIKEGYAAIFRNSYDTLSIQYFLIYNKGKGYGRKFYFLLENMTKILFKNHKYLHLDSSKEARFFWIRMGYFMMANINDFEYIPMKKIIN